LRYGGTFFAQMAWTGEYAVRVASALGEWQ
jgi:hypothetical protein